jgi:hypothetical protein
MNKKLQLIQQKIDAIQSGLLRFRDKDAQMTLQVRATTNEDNSLNCIITGDSPRSRLLNRNVNLIQKNHDDYLYINGTVSEEVNKKSKILSIHILKASWFVRKSKGSVSWLQEKYMYENFPQKEIRAAS